MEKIVIDNKLDANFKYEIAAKPGGENIKKCFACGTCTAGCPVFHVDHESAPSVIPVRPTAPRTWIFPILCLLSGIWRFKRVMLLPISRER
jgi:ferredoxin